MRSVADAVVRHLLHAGVASLFGVPGGGSNLDLIAAAGHLPASGVSLGSVRWCALAQSLGVASHLATTETNCAARSPPAAMPMVHR